MLQILKNIFKHLIKKILYVLVFGNMGDTRNHKFNIFLYFPFSQKSSMWREFVLAVEGTQCPGPVKNTWKLTNVKVAQRSHRSSELHEIVTFFGLFPKLRCLCIYIIGERRLVE